MDIKYQSNSHKSKEKEQNENVSAEKKLDKVITGKAVVKKKGTARKLTDIFVAEDANSVGEYIFVDIIVPTLKRLFVDMVSDAARMFAFGERGSSTRRSPAERYSYRSGYTDYNRASERRDPRYSGSSKPAYSYDDVYLESRGEAEEVLTRMDELIDEYGAVSVSDMYDLIGVTSEYTDNKYGWTDLRTASVERRRDGYVIKLPRAVALTK